MPRGGFLAPDGSGGQYQNEIETDRQFLADAVGGREGILRGYVATPDSGSLAWNITPGSAALTGSDTADQGTYYIWDAEDVVAPVNLPGVQSRVDALVIGCRDPQYGALPAGTAPGPFIEVVQGTQAASPTPPTDAMINAAVGPGAWRRWKDFRVDPGDTVIDPAGVTTVELATDVAYARIHQPGTQVISNAVLESVVFNTVDRSNRSGFAPGAIGLNIPGPGYYDIKCRKSWEPGINTGLRYLHVRVDGIVVATDVFRAFAGSGTLDTNLVSYSGYFDGGEVIDAQAFQDSGSALGSYDPIDDYLEVRQRRD